MAATRPAPSTAAPSVAPPVAARRSGRLVSLDAVRGLMLVVSVSVNSLLAPPEWFDHAVWDEVHPIDLVFPVFVTLSGCGLAFALHRRVAPAPLLRRAAVLAVAGLAYNAVTTMQADPGTWRLPGILQLYAAVVVLVGLGHLLTRSWTGWALLTAGAAALHTGLLAWYATGCTDGVLTRACNPSGAVDPAVFGLAHVYQQGAAGHDPEGLVAVLGAFVTAAAGATAGHLLLRRAGRARTAVALTGLAAGLLVLGRVAHGLPGLLTGEEVPAMKRLWTAPFALEVAAGVALALLLAHLLLDRAPGRRVQAASWPLVALGRNSLLVYFGSHVVMALLLRTGEPGGTPPARRLAEAVDVVGHPQVSLTVGVVLAWVALAAVLHAKRLYLRP